MESYFIRNICRINHLYYSLSRLFIVSGSIKLPGHDRFIANHQSFIHVKLHTFGRTHQFHIIPAVILQMPRQYLGHHLALQIFDINKLIGPSPHINTVSLLPVCGHTIIKEKAFITSCTSRSECKNVFIPDEIRQNRSGTQLSGSLYQDTILHFPFTAIGFATGYIIKSSLSIRLNPDILKLNLCTPRAKSDHAFFCFYRQWYTLCFTNLYIISRYIPYRYSPCIIRTKLTIIFILHGQ